MSSHSRADLLRYKIAPKYLLSGPFHHSGVGRYPEVAGRFVAIISFLHTPVSPVPHRSGTPLRGLQPALRAGLHPGHHQPAFRRVDRGVRIGTPHRRAAGPVHPPRPYPGDERRQLPPPPQPAERRLPGLGRAGRLLTQSGPGPVPGRRWQCAARSPGRASSPCSHRMKRLSAVL